MPQAAVPEKLRLESSHRRYSIDGFRFLVSGCAIIVVLILIGILISLVLESLPAIKAFGFKLLTTSDWSPSNNTFGALSAIYGTLVSSIIAMFIAVPTSFAVAVFMTEIAPKVSRKGIKILVDMMAGIPSIVYGMWGLFVFVPLMASTIEPWLSKFIGPLPIIGGLFSGPPIGIGLLTAGIVLSFMIVPTMASMLSDILATAPGPLREAAWSTGVTRYAVIRYVVFPYVRPGVLGCAMLGLGRALGETMAVTFVIGNSHAISSMLFMPSTTISASIANEFNEATGHLYPSALMTLALILFAITFGIILLSRLMLTKYRRH